MKKLVSPRGNKRSSKATMPAASPKVLKIPHGRVASATPAQTRLGI